LSQVRRTYFGRSPAGSRHLGQTLDLRRFGSAFRVCVHGVHSFPYSESK
jgi:hypothetical protein